MQKKSSQIVLFSSKKALVVPLLSTAKWTKPGQAKSARWHQIKTKSDRLSLHESQLSEYVATKRPRVYVSYLPIGLKTSLL